jgi:leucyl aminopeptidase (aminopeptidase T)
MINPGYLKKYAVSLDIGKYRKALENTFKNILHARPGESVLIVTSFATPEQMKGMSRREIRGRRESYTMARFLEREARKSALDVKLVAFKATLRNGVEPPKKIAELMPGYNINILIPWDSLTHTRARIAASRAGVRTMSSPHFTADMMENGGPMCADYRKIQEKTRRIADMLNKAEWARITAENGTDLKVWLIKGSAGVDDGDLSRRGSTSNLPAGETYTGLMPKGEGLLIGMLKGQEIRIEVEGGYAKKILSKNRVSKEVKSILFEGAPESLLKKRRQLAELGIGTNDMLLKDMERWTFSTLTAEKIPGAHIAFGDNTSFGGSNSADYHQDFVVLFANVELDTGPLIRKGKPVWL